MDLILILVFHLFDLSLTWSLTNFMNYVLIENIPRMFQKKNLDFHSYINLIFSNINSSLFSVF